MKHTDLTVRGWRDYELLDSGGNRKLERYGEFVLVRPETQALWPAAKPELWKRAVAEFSWNEGKGAWRKNKDMPESWEMGWDDIRFVMRLTSFKHTGIFPEQAANWEWLREQVMRRIGAGRGGGNVKVLNLFGYTGIASIVAARRGAQVTHVDASRQSNEWARENARLSGVPAENIRYLSDDALRFAEREVRRGSVYDGIVLDPPAFGRGAKGEIWRIEEHLPRLLAALAKIFSAKPGAFFLLNGYAAGYSPRSFRQTVEGVFPEAGKLPHAGFGELQVLESGSERCIPSGIYVRFVR
ncbi:MAG TPA: class I SAM-dependent methyltransferase [Candidatus Paceibacterota bacterium]|nr:class I SAM-dependent methyltransferase [Candidatus Paceibacterota bacterium]